MPYYVDIGHSRPYSLDFTDNLISSKIYSKGHFTTAYGHGSNKTLKGAKGQLGEKHVTVQKVLVALKTLDLLIFSIFKLHPK
jgi:hypothetical protein